MRRRLLVAAAGLALVACALLDPAPEIADWYLDPQTNVMDPSITEIHVLVRERACASGRPATDRIASPEIEYGDTEVTITIRVTPATGDQDCQGNPLTPFTVTLEQPLAARQLIQGGVDRPAELVEIQE